MKKVAVLLLVVALYTSCRENQQHTAKESISPETQDSIISGILNRMVRSVKQAKNGDMLIASYIGVLRYDGKSFTNLTSTIPSPSFWDVLEDRKGNLWFASRDSGVYYYEGNTEPDANSAFKHFTRKDGLGSNQITSMYEDRAGNIWFATGGGASRHDGKSFQNFTSKDGLSNNAVSTILEDKSGKIWFGTRGDACYYDGKTFTTFTNKDGKPFYNVWAIIEDRKGNIWLGGSIIKGSEKISDKGVVLTREEGLWRYDGSSFTRVAERVAAGLLEDKNGNIWATGPMRQNGEWAVFRYDQDSLYNKTLLVPEIMPIQGSKMLTRLAEAADGSIWIGALDGVYRYDGEMKKL